tara:strand:- start:6859 stop:7086 length:228 start_codon:yes stop_codon:yes gene_type:complete
MNSEITKMVGKSRILDDRQKSVIKKAIALYMGDLYRKNSRQSIDDERLQVDLSVVNEICELLHLKHNESSSIPEC